MCRFVLPFLVALALRAQTPPPTLDKPPQDVIQNMKTHDIKVDVLRRKPGASAFVVSFRHQDPLIAQRTTLALVQRLVNENFTMQKSGGSMVLDLLDPASLPRKPTAPNRLTIMLTGLAAGIITGFLVALMRRKLRPA